MSDALIIPNPERPGEDMMLITEFDGLEKNKKFYQFYFIDKTKQQEGLQGPFDLKEFSSGTGIAIQYYYELGTQKVTDKKTISTNLSIYRGPKKENVITNFDELEKYKRCYQFFFIDDLSSDQKLNGPYDLEETVTYNDIMGGNLEEMRTYKDVMGGNSKLRIYHLVGDQGVVREVAYIDKKTINPNITIFRGPKKTSGCQYGIMGGTRRKKSKKSKKSNKSRKSKKSRKFRKSRK